MVYNKIFLILFSLLYTIDTCLDILEEVPKGYGMPVCEKLFLKGIAREIYDVSLSTRDNLMKKG
jgi:hypothetical protein